PTTLPVAAIAPHALGETPQTVAVPAPHPRDSSLLPTPYPEPPALCTTYQVRSTAVTHACRKLTYNRSISIEATHNVTATTAPGVLHCHLRSLKFGPKRYTTAKHNTNRITITTQ